MNDIIEKFNRKEVYKNGRISIYEDEYGKENKRFTKTVIEHPNAGGILPILPDGKILLIEQYRASIDKMVLEIPAGAVEEEDIDEKACAIRELFEETGYEIETCEHLIDDYPWSAYTNQKISIYVGFGAHMKKEKYQDIEFIKKVVFTYEELYKKIILGEIMDAKTIIAFMVYYQKYIKI